MKKIGAIFASLALALCLTACSSNENSDGGISAPALIQNSSITSSSSTTSSISSTNTGSSETSFLSEESSASESSSDSNESVPESGAPVKSNESVLESSAPVESNESVLESSAPVESSEPKQSGSEPTSSEPAASVQSEPESQPEPAPEENKTLVVYFTWSSNTTGMAETIADLTGADTFEIVPVVPYPEEYTPCTEVALEERDNNSRPEIQNLPASVSEYDNILIGYPIWWHTAPMIIGTFLENYDLTGIDVYPFTQSASMNEEQFEQSMDFVRGCAGSAEVHDGLFARPSDTAAITSYLEQNGLTKQANI